MSSLSDEAQPQAVSASSSPTTLLEEAKLKWRQLFSGSEPRDPISIHRQSSPTLNNFRTNVPWGDPMGPKDPTITRLYSINVNGISLDRRGGTFEDICRSIKEIQADIFCAQEHNLDTSQFKIRSSIFDTARQHWERHRITMGTTPITVETSYKPGGTLIMTVGSLMGRVVKQSRDKWGRWVIQEFTGRGDRRVVIFSVYQPIDKSSQQGKITVAAQQTSLLCLAQDTVTNPRTAFRRDLLAALRSYNQEGTLLIVVGDFNEHLGTDPEGMVKIAGTLGLIDLMASRHSSAPPATYARGSKRLDYALANPLASDALISAGYEEFNAHFISDHRGYFFDFDTDMLFGSGTQQLATREKRGLLSNNVHQVTEYIREKHRILFDHHNASRRVLQLSFPGNRHEYAERLDSDVLSASLVAEAKTRRVGEPAWSVELAQARKVVSILKKHLSSLKTGYDNSDKLTRALAELDVPFELPPSKVTCSRALRAAETRVKEIVADSYQQRDQERRKKIEDLEASQHNADKTKAKILRRLKKAEDLKELFRKLKHVRGQKTRQGVTRIEIPLHPLDDPKTCTEWTQVEVPTEILRLLQERNRKHFGQAHGTPFTIPPLAEELGFKGDGKIGDDILHGTYSSFHVLDDNVQLLLRHLHHVHEIAETPSFPTISDDEFCAKLRVWAESTTTSPSGMHLGHYKALIARHSYSSDASDEDLSQEFRDNRDELNRMQNELRAVHLALLNYALERGYSYRRWQTIANTILFKDEDNVRLHRTRVIHIYEADFNLALGIKWRIAMYQAEALAVLNEGQFGSRPRRNATDPVFMEELQCEISRATRKPVVLTNYDATACYDRIIPSIGMLVSRKFGVPFQVTQTNAETLEKAEYRIRTELGLAPTGYSHSDDMPIYGTGQGSANSPAIWCFLSSCLFDSYDEIAQPATYVSPDNSTSVSIGMVGFVDDCNGQTNTFLSDGSEATLSDVLQHAQTNAQQWSNLLHVSGGALELSKCSCHVLQWLFSMQGAPVLAPKTDVHQQFLKVHDPATGILHDLQLLSPYQAHKTLGHYKDPAGKQTEQYKQLKSKSDDLTTFLWKCPLTKLETWTFYYACYLPSVTYPLSCSSISRQRLESVQRRAMSIIVPRCGFNRNTKREILYGPLELGGANFRHLYVEQGVGQIGLFIKNWRLRSMAGKLLRIAVGWFQVQVGTSFSILERVHPPLPHLESKWLASLRDFLASIDASLQLDNPGIPPLQRCHDTYIMDGILSSGKFTAAEIRRLNYCRLYLQAQTLSDLTNITGDALDPAKLAGQISAECSVTHGVHINQERPSVTEWKLWRQANLLWSDERGRLHQPLGPWIQPIKKQRQRHQAYRLHRRLWVRVHEQFMQCRLSADGDDVYHYTNNLCSWQDIAGESLPVDVLPASPTTWRVSRASSIFIPKVVHPATFDQYVQTLAPWEAELLSHMDCSTDAFTISEALTHGLRGVSDGSVWLKQMGAYGWILSTDVGERAAEGMGPAPGATPTSYRSEAYGMLAILCFLKRLAEFTYQYEPWQGILATDSLSLIDTIRGVTRHDMGETLDVEYLAHDPTLVPLDPFIPDWDLLVSIRRLLKEMPGLKLQHVRGHQDRRIAYRQLSLLAQLNVDADKLANTYQRDHGAIRPIAHLTEGAGVHLVTAQGSITSNYKKAIRHQATYKPLLEYIQSRQRWSGTEMRNINWTAHGTSLNKRMKQRDHYIKLVHGILPTNHKLHRNDPSRRGCPSCNHRDEDWTHILRCQNPSREAWRTSMLEAIKDTCDKWNTRPLLRDILVEGIREWLESPDPDDYNLDQSSYDDAHLCQMIHQQNNIGWKHLFLGRFTWGWSDVQDAYYVSRPDYNQKKCRTGSAWQVAIISCLWDQWYLLWECRNQALHGATKQQTALIERQNAQRTLRELYALRNHYEPSVRDLLMADIRDHEVKPTWHLKAWLAIHEPVLRASYTRARKLAISGMRSLRQYWTGT